MKGREEPGNFSPLTLPGQLLGRAEFFSLCSQRTTPVSIILSWAALAMVLALLDDVSL